jgi:hypothetical protein
MAPRRGAAARSCDGAGRAAKTSARRPRCRPGDRSPEPVGADVLEDAPVGCRSSRGQSSSAAPKSSSGAAADDREGCCRLSGSRRSRSPGCEREVSAAHPRRSSAVIGSRERASSRPKQPCAASADTSAASDPKTFVGTSIPDGSRTRDSWDCGPVRRGHGSRAQPTPALPTRLAESVTVSLPRRPRRGLPGSWSQDRLQIPVPPQVRVGLVRRRQRGESMSEKPPALPLF